MKIRINKIINIISIIKKKYIRSIRPGKQDTIFEEDGLTLRNDLLVRAFLVRKGD